MEGGRGEGGVEREGMNEGGLWLYVVFGITLYYTCQFLTLKILIDSRLIVSLS